MGGIIGVISAILIYVMYIHRKWCHETLLVLDTLIPYIPIGIFFGRFGNFLNQELYGIIFSNAQWWLSDRFVHLCQKTHLLYIYTQIGPERRINTNMLSMLCEWVMLWCIVWYIYSAYRRAWRVPVGVLSIVFLIVYSSIRFCLEYLRYDSQQELIGSMSITQYICLGFLCIGIYLYTYISWKNT